MTAGRRGPLSFLDTEWRTALWKRWVATHLVPEANAPADPVTATPPVAAGPQKPTSSALDGEANLNGSRTLHETTGRANATTTTRAEPPKRALGEGRNADVRARFDAITDRLQGLEDAIDVIARRLSHRTRRERRTDRRTGELVESIAETVDAQAAAIDGLASTLERIERRLDRTREDERRDSRAPKARNSEPPRNGTGRADETGEFAPVRPDAEDSEAAFSGSSIRGSIGDMSLSTVLAMIEIERRSGRLKVQNEDGSIAAFELEDGSVASSRVSENDVDAVESLREVLTWKNGRFWFRQNPSESQVSPPRSVNSLLLEATRQLDEAVRAS